MLGQHYLGYAVICQLAGKSERSKWILRTNETHRGHVKKLQTKYKTKTKRQSKEKKYGCRYSVLLHLPYFDPVRMLLIDPMHNLLLGSAKYVTRKLWISNNVLSASQLEIIHTRMVKLTFPVDIGRLPAKLDSGATFTAEQWLNWTIYYSVYCIHGLLSTDETECWRHFVLACRRLCSQIIRLDDVTIADALLLHFCERIKRLYSGRFITPNIHLHYHLADCVKDYGPLQTFWLFSFERFNGVLGNQPTNNHAIEIQLMKRFLKDNLHRDLFQNASSMQLSSYFEPVIGDYLDELDVTKVLNDYITTATDVSEPSFMEPPVHTLAILDFNEISNIKKFYTKSYPDTGAIHSNDFLFPTSVKKFSYILMNGKRLPSVTDTTAKVPYVLAKPTVPFTSTGIESRPVQIQYFFKHSFKLDNDTFVSQVFVVVKWLQVHPQRHIMGKPAEIWCDNLYEDKSENKIAPVENITSRVAISSDSLDGYDNILVFIPLLHK